MDGQEQYCLYMVYYYYCATVEAKAYKKKIFSFCFPIFFWSKRPYKNEKRERKREEGMMQNENR